MIRGGRRPGTKAGGGRFKKQKPLAWKADNGWHELTLATEGGEMRLAIDGKPVCSHRSEAYAHPAKRWLSISAQSTVWVAELKVWKVK